MFPCDINDYILFNTGMKDALKAKDMEDGFKSLSVSGKKNIC